MYRSSSPSPLSKLPELYTSAENFNNKSKKSNFQKICGTSFEEACQLLGKKRNATSFDSRYAVRRDEPLPVMQIQVNKEEPKPMSMADLLHHSLLTGYLVPLEQLSRSQQRLTKIGIPPPTHTFPYAFRTDEPIAIPTSTFRTRIQSTTFHKLLLSSVAPERLDFEDKTVHFFSTEPGKTDWQTYQGHNPGKQAGSCHNQVTLASKGKEAVMTECQQILSPGFKMMGLGNGRRSMKSPPLIMAALVACVIVLGFNYWIASSRSVELQSRILELEVRVRRAAAERGAVELKKNEFQ
ncbi:hypothetical protein STEG23_011412, partial [Scotinomys teguina]